MKERPIIFSGEMVKAILAGRKTQTRRIIKQPEYYGCLTGDCPHDKKSQCEQWLAENAPFGDHLWVKETFLNNALKGYEPVYFYRADDEDKPADRKWTPSIYMPRTASRLTLNVISVRAERLQAISEPDCLAEGIIKQLVTVGRKEGRPDYEVFALRDGNHCEWEMSGKVVFRKLWIKINGEKSWAENPWVWVVTFKKSYERGSKV